MSSMEKTKVTVHAWRDAIFDKTWFTLYWHRPQPKRGEKLIKESSLNSGQAYNILTQRFQYTPDEATQMINAATEKRINNER